ncbi:MAG: hydrogenase iron-sulfur subunit [Proteobacteria bacterium]|nr:hydrogenase iron-sulfur subunit [Pseudomonadota bacterium]
MPENVFEPRLVAFCCRNSAYAKERDGILKNYSLLKILKIVELPCSGKIEAYYFLKAFEEGADGAYLVGCPRPDCHYLEGNLRAIGRVGQAKKLLNEIGIGGERVELYLLDPAIPAGFWDVTLKMIDRIISLGPSPLNKGGAQHA